MRKLFVLIVAIIGKFLFNLGRWFPSLVPCIQGILQFIIIRAKDKDVKVEKIKPLNENFEIYCYSPKASSDKKLPILMYIHGGGFKYQHTYHYDDVLTRICKAANCLVMSVEYKKSSSLVKHPFIFNSCKSAFDWIKTNATLYNPQANINSIHIAGDSAGGNLTAALCFDLATKKETSVKSQIVIYGCLTDDETRLTYQSSKDYGTNGYIIDTTIVKYFSAEYFGEDACKKKDLLIDTSVFPLHFDDSNKQLLNNIPPTLVIVAEQDVLRDENIHFAEKLQKNGVQCELYVANGEIHGFFQGHYMNKEQQDKAIDLIVQRVKSD